jgi:orotidine-5'-phosphate decarboxylase
MNYNDILLESAKKSGNITCMGLDPKVEVLPEGMGLTQYFQTLFNEMLKKNLIPAAFKPNIGYYQSLDKPREGIYKGSIALSSVLDMIDIYFPGIPVILDSKRGDIARSSLNYEIEAFTCWKADAVTVSPYMGTDSVSPFQVEGKGIYVLNRTSNPGGKDLQNLLIDDGMPLDLKVSQKIVEWSEGNKGLGAVVGATSMKELSEISSFYSNKEIPMLIPGVGAQGGSATDVIKALNETGYPLHLARINSSSGLTHPWKKGVAPENWLELCTASISELLKETKVTF